MIEICSGCGLELPATAGPTHAYLGASASCWKVYGEVLAREFQDPAYFSVHQLTVDTYAAQHPGRPERRTIQSVALHLTTLALVFERGADPANGPEVHKRLAHRADYVWLEPPQPVGSSTIADVHGATTPMEHRDAVRRWALDVWETWGPHHATVLSWLDLAE